MKAAIRTLSSIAKSQNTTAKTIARAHRDKNEQCLLSSRSALTSSSVYYLHNYCDERVAKDPMASLVLIMIYSGRNCYEVIDNLKLIAYCDDQEELRLHTPWAMPGSDRESNTNDGSTSTAANMYLVLPIRLKPTVKLKEYLDYKKKVESWVQSFVPANEALPNERFTLNRIKLLLSHYGAFAGISDYENAFISAKNLEDESHQSYGIVDRHQIQFKFDVFCKALKKNDLNPQVEIFESADFLAVGSNFSTDTATVSTYIERITSKATNVALNLEQHCSNFNILTEFTVAYLSLCTLHRPRLSPFGTIKNFDLHSGVVSILDKGVDSFRQTPLCDTALVLVINYRDYLTSFEQKYKHVNPKLSADIASILAGDEPLFQKLNFRTKRLVEFKADFMGKYTDNLKLKNNYERHYVTSVLVKKGYSRNDLKLLLDHTSPSTRGTRFNSSDYNLLHSLVNEIENHINTPTLEGGLGIKIPRYLYGL
jgi:hypothetical protein